MEDQNGVEFVAEMRLNEGDPFYRNQIMMDAVVKQEDCSDHDQHRVMAMEVCDGEERRNVASPLKKPMPKVIQHRRCSCIQKVNTAAVLRHLVRRGQPIADVQHIVHTPSTSSTCSVAQATVGQVPTQLANEAVELISSAFAPNEHPVGQQSASAHSIYSGMGDTSFYQMPNLANWRPLHSAPMDIVPMMQSNVGESEIFSTNGEEMANLYEIAVPELTFGSVDTALAEYVKIEMNVSADPINMNGQQVPSTDAMQINSTDANRCAACAQSFKTPKNLEKHLLSKKHAKKMMRLNKRKPV